MMVGETLVIDQHFSVHFTYLTGSSQNFQEGWSGYDRAGGNVTLQPKFVLKWWWLQIYCLCVLLSCCAVESCGGDVCGPQTLQWHDECWAPSRLRCKTPLYQVWACLCRSVCGLGQLYLMNKAVVPRLVGRQGGSYNVSISSKRAVTQNVWELLE